MTYQCSACQRSFAEPGFCPFDGKELAAIAAADSLTVLSESMRAQSEPPDTAIDPVTRPGIGDSTNQVKAISAHEGTADAIAHIRKEVRGKEYDYLVGETLDGRYHVQRKIGEGG